MNSETTKDTHTKDTTSISGIYDNDVRLSSKDKKLEAYIIEKTSRIVSVTIMLGGWSKRHDTLHDEIEKTSVRLVSYAARAYEQHEDRRAFLRTLNTLVALLDVAARTHRIAESNTKMIISELLMLKTFIAELEWGSGRTFVPLDRTALPTPHELVGREPAISDILRVGREKDTSATDTARYETHNPEQRPAPVNDTRPHTIRHNVERVHDAQKDRRATILGMLQRKDRVTVRDVAHIIKDCSEKTLQRELLALVAQGVLVKEGERRWSTYRLA
jgi:hypothetical protein